MLKILPLLTFSFCSLFASYENKTFIEFEKDFIKGHKYQNAHTLHAQYSISSNIAVSASYSKNYGEWQNLNFFNKIDSKIAAIEIELGKDIILDSYVFFSFGVGRSFSNVKSHSNFIYIENKMKDEFKLASIGARTLLTKNISSEILYKEDFGSFVKNKFLKISAQYLFDNSNLSAGLEYYTNDDFQKSGSGINLRYSF